MARLKNKKAEIQIWVHLTIAAVTVTNTHYVLENWTYELKNSIQFNSQNSGFLNLSAKD